jgi:hypothetical protein
MSFSDEGENMHGGRSFALGTAVALIALTITLAVLAHPVIGATTGEAENATLKYHNLAVAKAHGYGLLKDKNGVSCIAMDGMPQMGAMGVHYVKKALVGDAVINAKTPEALVYEPTQGKLRLVAVEYVVLKSAWDAHHTAAPRLFGHPFNFTPAGNRFGLPPYYSLHAWIWKFNPSGQFSMWNPAVTCK